MCLDCHVLEWYRTDEIIHNSPVVPSVDRYLAIVECTASMALIPYDVLSLFRYSIHWCRGRGGGGGAIAPPHSLDMFAPLMKKKIIVQYASHSTKSVLSMKQMLSSSIKIFASDVVSCRARKISSFFFLGGGGAEGPRE